MIGFSKEKQVGKPKKKAGRKPLKPVMLTDFKGYTVPQATPEFVDKFFKNKKKRKPLKLMSRKAKEELKVWTAVKRERIRLLAEKFGVVVCEECGQLPDWRGFALHHIKFRSRTIDNNSDNALLLCYNCHSKKHNV